MALVGLGVCVVALLLALLQGVDCAQYVVGGKHGWALPSLANSLNYTQWVDGISFHQGDFLEFKYGKENEALLEVTRSAYRYCNTSDPIASFKDGSTVIELSKPGSYYFISGHPGHCEAGQKLMLRVPFASSLASSSASPPMDMVMAPAPEPAGPTFLAQPPARGAASAPRLSLGATTLSLTAGFALLFL